MLIDFFLFALALAMIWISGAGVVRYALHIADLLNVSSYFVGFILLAFATGLPEFVVAVFSLLAGKPQLSFGNLMGSNLVNTTLALGIPATFIGPIIFTHDEQRENLILLFITTVITSAIFALGFLYRFLSIPLAIIYVVGIYWLWQQQKKQPLIDVEKHYNFSQTIRIIAGLVISIAVLLIGSQVAVNSALRIAEYFNLSLTVLGATLFALASTLPEIIVTIMALREGDVSLAIGNIVGSTFTNCTLALSVVASGAIDPIPIRSIIYVLPFIIFSFLLIGTKIIQRKNIVRRDGLLLIGNWILFIMLEFLFIKKI